MTILFKNFPNQTVYTRAVSITGGVHTLKSGLSGATENGLTAWVSKDGGTRYWTSQPVREVGDGIYRITLTDTETNCDSGIVHIVCGPTAWFLFDPVPFQTSSTAPVVGITSSSADFIANTVKGLTYDGNITQSKLNEMLLAFLFGAVDYSTSNGINTYSFKGSTGMTSFTSVAVATDGTRPVRGTTGP